MAKDNHQQRRNRLRRKLRSRGIDCLLVSNRSNVTYLTGFTGEASYLLVTAKKDLLVSDSRFTIQLQDECADLDV
ncbi:MAG: aminopeptidase P family N-terminal domain-containing protein, partial [Planctomycetota bacterium]